MNRLIRLYPAAWRERYGDELAALLEERPPTVGDRLDIVRGALDARLHAQVPGHHIPLGHRIPGLMATAAGLLLCIAFVGITLTAPGEDWGGIEGLFGMALVLGFLSLPGTYFERYARQLKWGFVGGIGLVVLAAVLPWPLLTVPYLGLYALVLAGTLALAAARAGISAKARWVLVALVFVPETVFTLGIWSVGAGVDEGDGALVILALVLPYAVAWVLVGLLMAIRGTPTFNDDPATTAQSAAVTA